MKLFEIRSKFPTVNIISHTDLDGYGSAAAMVAFLSQTLGYHMDDIEVNHCFPSDPYDLKPGFNIITDLSVNSAGNWERMVEHNRNPENLIWWIDHHITSLDVIDKHPELKEIPRAINTGYAATMLCWEIHKISNLLGEHLGVEPFDVDSDDIFRMLNDENYAAGIHAPTSVRLTDDWDLFKRKIPSSQFYNTAFNSCPRFYHDAKSPYCQAAFGDIGFSDERDRATVEDAARYLIEFGEDATRWQRYLYLKNLMNAGFLCSLDPVDWHDETADEIRKIRFITVNRIDFNLVSGAESLMKEYTWGMAFQIRDTGVTHTVYCTRPSGNLSAKEVCYRFGGGGHPGCAGFVSNGMMIKNLAPLDDNMKLLIRKDLRDIRKQVAPPIENPDVDDLLRSRSKEVAI